MRTFFAASCTIALTLIAAPADAGHVTVRDQRGDVLQGRVDFNGGYARQSGIREGDVVRTTFRHGPANIVVVSKFRALDRVGNYHGYYLRLQTGAGLTREVDVEARPNNWKGRLTVTRRDGTAVRCGATHRINYSLNRVRVVIPRRCLGDPVSVRGTAANAWTHTDADDPSQPDYVQLDNPHNTDADANTWTRLIKRG